MSYNLQAENVETATLGMGCFWGPDSLFGSLPGVIHTKVGFTGGTTENPTYRQMGDHTETVQITYDSDKISYGEILHTFWSNHNAVKDRFYKERQYLSILLHHNEEQEIVARRVKKEWKEKLAAEIQTEFQPLHRFFQAEDHHQKYNLKRFKKATTTIRELFPKESDFVNATIVARLNGFVKEHGKMEQIEEEIETWHLSLDTKDELLQLLNRIKW
ncbi:peptide-methionine (S)-S-oxide reductase MsrA [Radiobacillus kanasensis]|uniref:peptide-methionine (S)-S-oxide reductase MsrA n=1 Tax=Radiobacillus kanasensis TaxID=2844358 RepID=UPI001E34086E|nr:peptide-methionine (S)-S-oxide reductase MsrA [Radiobacillus kanasensis]UFU00649.1 peptide-methionine (S)-S-oxide reductase MsrA [Radiobacillus kanasensis]